MTDNFEVINNNAHSPLEPSWSRWKLYVFKEARINILYFYFTYINSLISEMTPNKKIVFTEYAAAASPPNSVLPTEIPVLGKHFKLVEDTIDLDAELSEGDMLLKTLDIVLDPSMVTRFREPSVESYSVPHTINETIADETVSVVLKSNNANYKVGDIVYGRNAYGLMQEYVQVDSAYAKDHYVVRNGPKESGVPLPQYVGALGISGLTAYYG